MNADEKPPVEVQARKQDPREVLDPVKRVKILALLEMGCSRRMAGKQVGCAGSTITRTADRDPEFHAQLARAEGQSDIRALKLLRRTAEQEKYWRVAAWILERRNPEEYGRRAPHTFTGEQVMSLLARGMQSAMSAIPDDAADEFMQAFEDVLADVAYEANLPQAMEVVPEVAEPAPVPAPTQAAQGPGSPLAKPRSPITSNRTKPAESSTRESVATANAPRPNGHVVASTERPVEEKRRSCLEQFVVRSRKPELEAVGK